VITFVTGAREYLSNGECEPYIYEIKMNWCQK
jgi:hypothetical protein